MKPSDVQSLTPDDLATTVSQLKGLLDSPGWRILRQALAAEQHANVEMVLAQPKGTDDPGSYALARADRAGYARGLRYADTVGHKILQRAEQALKQEQAAAEAGATHRAREA